MLPKQARGTSRKHVTKPFTQPAAPDCNEVDITFDGADSGFGDFQNGYGLLGQLLLSRKVGLIQEWDLVAPAPSVHSTQPS